MAAISPFSHVTIRDFHLEDDGQIPNHPSWPLLVYENVLPDPSAEAWEALFEGNDWRGTWRNGIFFYTIGEVWRGNRTPSFMGEVSRNSCVGPLHVTVKD